MFNPVKIFLLLRQYFALALVMISFWGHCIAHANTSPLVNPGPVIKKITQVTGQSIEQVNDLLQSKSGFIWLATANGLLRFDGYNLKTFQPEQHNHLTNNHFTGLIQDKNTMLWLMSSGGGLSRFNPLTEQFMHFQSVKDDLTTLSSNQLNSMSLTADHTLWIASDNGINLFDLTTLKNQRFDTRLQHNAIEKSTIEKDTAGQGGESVFKILQDSQQRLWYSILDKGVFMRDPVSKMIHHFQSDPNDINSLESNFGSVIYETNDGVIWIGSHNAVNRFDPIKQNFTRFYIALQPQNREEKSAVSTLYQDKNQRLWIGTLFNGLSVLQPHSQTIDNVNSAFVGEDMFETMAINQIIGDSSGLLWFATKQNTLVQLNPDGLAFKHQQVNKENPATLLSGFTDTSGATWLGTASSLYSLDPVSQQFVLEADNVGYISLINQDSNGNIILGVGDKGIMTFNPASKKIKPYGSDALKNDRLKNDRVKHQVPALPSNNLHSLTVDPNGQLWVGLFLSSDPGRGVYSFDQSKHQYQQHHNQFTNETLLADTQQVLVGTRRNGLRMLDRSSNQWSTINDENHDVNWVWSLFKDSKGRIWVGSKNAGLVRLNQQGDLPKEQSKNQGKNRLTFINTTHGLASNNIKSIVEDKSGLLWLGTTKGISRYNPQNGEITNYGYHQGLRIRSFSSEFSTLTASGDIIMGSRSAVVRFSPDKLAALAKLRSKNSTTKRTTKLPILLSNFKRFNRPVQLQSTDPESPLAQTINALDHLTLSYQDSMFSLSFASSNYLAHNNNLRYAYKMEGLTSQWIPIDANNRTATFTSLPAKDYVFKVKTSLPDGRWSDNIRSLKITVTPPFWLTWQAYVLYVLMALTLFYVIYRIRTASLLKRAETLEQGVIERTATIELLMAQKERMFANISHEFKTPLTLILNPMDAILANPSAEDISRKVSMMKRNGHRLLRMIEQLLELSKLEAQTAEKQAFYSIKRTLDTLLTSFQPLFDSKNLTLKHPAFEDTVVLLKEDTLEMILINLISNAIKYTPVEGAITVTVTTNDTMVTLSVKDNGIGISPDNQKLVFNRFTRANEQHNEQAENIPGAGIGLALVLELVESQQGTITLQSEVGKGSNFIVTLPIADEQNMVVENLEHISSSSQSEISALSESTPQNQPNADEYTSDGHNEADNKAANLLLIDDNADMLELLDDTLNKKYHCFSAQNGEDGVAMALDKLPDLIISDVMMPGISGYDVVRQLKQAELTSHIPIILLTAKGDIQSRLKGWAENADEYLEKPFNATELMMRIDNLLSIRSLLRQRYQREFSQPVTAANKTPESVAVAQHEVQATPTNEDELVNPLNQAFFDRLNQILEKYYAEEAFDVAFLVGQMCMSHRQFGRKMKALLDLTPVETIRNFRLKKAAELLEQGTPSGIVADLVGFTSHSYFSKCFKAHFECMPSQFVERHQSS